MKKIIIIMGVVISVLISCTMEDIKHENDRTFIKDALLTIWMVREVYPIGECDPRSQQENCEGNYMQACNGHGQWENLVLCPTSCTEHPGQMKVECR